MYILTTESVDALRMEISKDPSIIHQGFDDLVENLQLNLLPTNYEFEGESNGLLLPTKLDDKDTENCKTIFYGLDGLTAAQATDERLWATLCFRDFKYYAEKRWPFPSKRKKETDKAARHVEAHYFAGTIRGRMRDNAISRLWWMGHIANKVSNWTIDEVLEVLFFNSDYRSSLLERHSSANAVNVLVSILKITKKAYSKGGRYEFNRQSFRDFMKKVDFIGARTLLPALSDKELTDILEPLYYESYGKESKKVKGSGKKKKKGKRKRRKR